MKRSLIAILCAVACTAYCVLLTGCDDWDALWSDTSVVQQTIDVLGTEQAALAEALERTRADLEAAGEDTAQIDALAERVEAVTARVDEVFEEAQEVAQRVAEAQTPIEGVAEGARALAPLAGPYAPWILLATNILTGLVARRRGRAGGAVAVAGPIEAARNRELEEKLNAESGANGPNFIVFDRAVAGVGHGSNGVKAAISSVG